MKLHTLAIIGVSLLPLSRANADVLFSLTPSGLNTFPGGTVDFVGTLTNLGGTDVFLNGDSAGLLPSNLTIDDAPFFNNAPLFLPANGGSYSGPFFDVSVDPTSASGMYSGTFTIQGGVDSNSFDNLASQTFHVTVTTTPEPATFLLLLPVFWAIGFGTNRSAPLRACDSYFGTGSIYKIDSGTAQATFVSTTSTTHNPYF